MDPGPRNFRDADSSKRPSIQPPSEDCTVCSYERLKYRIYYVHGKAGSDMCAKCQALEQVVRFCIDKHILGFPPLDHGVEKRGKISWFAWDGRSSTRWCDISWSGWGMDRWTTLKTKFRVFSLPGETRRMTDHGDATI